MWGFVCSIRCWLLPFHSLVVVGSCEQPALLGVSCCEIPCVQTPLRLGTSTVGTVLARVIRSISYRCQGREELVSFSPETQMFKFHN